VSTKTDFIMRMPAEPSSEGNFYYLTANGGVTRNLNDPRVRGFPTVVEGIAHRTTFNLDWQAKAQILRRTTIPATAVIEEY
jgi:hypothetical protein